MTTYQWTHYRAVSAQIVGETVAAIEANEGACHPKRLVDEARPTDSPLHPLFTWDDVAAADSWRTHQARNIINDLTVTVQVQGQPISAPAFVSVGRVPDDQVQGYQGLTTILASAERTDTTLKAALTHLRGLQRRYQTIQQLASVWNALDAIEYSTAEAAD